MMTAAAPSLMPDALPAVTVPEPSVRKQGLSRLRTVESGLGCSSTLMTVVPKEMRLRSIEYIETRCLVGERSKRRQRTIDVASTWSYER